MNSSNPADIIAEQALTKSGVVKSIVAGKQPWIVQTAWKHLPGRSMASLEVRIYTSSSSKYSPISSSFASLPEFASDPSYEGRLERLQKFFMPILPVMTDKPSAKISMETAGV